MEDFTLILKSKPKKIHVCICLIWISFSPKKNKLKIDLPRPIGSWAGCTGKPAKGKACAGEAMKLPWCPVNPGKLRALLPRKSSSNMALAVPAVEADGKKDNILAVKLELQNNLKNILKVQLVLQVCSFAFFLKFFSIAELIFKFSQQKCPKVHLLGG